jgi:Glycosyltransferase family 87
MGVSIFATALLGWGTEITLMRGNIEGILWIPVCIGAWFYARRKYGAAGASFGVAACLKPYPILWLALMARHRRYRGALVGLLTAAAVTVGSLMYFNPNPIRGYRAISEKTNFFNDYIVSFRPMEEMMVDHSLLQTIKTIARVVRNHGLHFAKSEFWHHPNDPLAWKLYHAYLPVMGLIGVAVLWLTWNKPVLNQVFALTCVTTVLPFIAADYTLLALLIPMAFFLIYLLQDVATDRVHMPLSHMLWYLLPCAWIMGINPLWHLHGVLKCIALLALLGASLFLPLPTSVFGELSPKSKPDYSVADRV